ncbi:MAG: carboxypeptidase regulatory-like domain-containing protein [Myxococcota bacterium]
MSSIQPLSRLALSVVALALAAGCNRDLSLPEQPTSGAVIGLVDTTPISPSGHTIALVDTEGRRREATSASDGSFRFDDVTPGLYAIDLRIQGFSPLVVPNVRVNSGQTVDVGILAPVFRQTSSGATGMIRGRVTNAAGGAVLGTKVLFYLPSSSDPLVTAVADADGAFDAQVTSGTWRLLAQHPWYLDGTKDNVEVAEGQTVDLRMDPIVLQIRPGTVTGTVLKAAEDGTTTPAEGALVSLSTGTNQATTDAMGAYTINNVVAGSHQLTVTLAEYDDARGPRLVTVQPNVTTTVDPIQLELLRAMVRGTVETADGAPADSVYVALTPGGFGAVAATGQVASHAQFVLTGIPYGDYTVSFTKSGYFRATTQVRVRSPLVSVPNVVLAPQSGDFVIDDDDPDSKPTYTRTRNVKLVFTSAAAATEVRASEDQNFAGATFQPYMNNLPTTLSSGEGLKTVFVQLKDANGVVGPTLSSTITLDTTPPPAPIVTLDSTGAGPTGVKFTTSNVTLPLRVIASDSLTGIAGMRLAGDPTLVMGQLPTALLQFDTNTSFTRSTTVDGVQSVYVQVIDLAGNASMLGTDTVVVDRTLPSGSLTLTRGPQATANGYTNQPMVEAALSAGQEPDGGVVQVKLANDTGAQLDSALYQGLRPSLSWFLDTSSEGVKTVYAQFRDTAGNVSAPVSATITYDVTPPAPVSATVTPAVTRSTSVVVNVTGPTTELSATQAITVSENPTFTAAGTVGPMPFPGTGQVPFTLSSGDGPRTIYVRFKDHAGNTSIATAQVTLDQTPPTTPTFAFTPSGTRGTTKFLNVATSLPFTLTGVDALSGVTQMRLATSNAVDAQGRLTGASSVAWTPAGSFTRMAGEGAVTVYAQLLDAAGNASPVVSDTVVVDTVVPSGTLSIARGTRASVDGYTNEGVVNLSLSAPAEPNGGAVMVKLANSNGVELTQAAYQDVAATSWFLNTASEGLKTVYAVFRDSAGNESTPVSATITYDVTAPTPATASITPATTRTLGVTVSVASSAGDLSPTQALTLSESSSFSGAGTVGPQAMPGGGTVAFTLSSGGDGLRTVYVRFRDRAGNDTVVPATVTVDQTPPSGTIELTGLLADGVTPSASLTASTDVTVSLRVTGATEYLLGTTALTTCPATGYTAMPPSGQVTYALAGGTAGVREVRGCFRDAAGNTFGGLSGTWAPSASITYDATPPASCALSASGFTRSGGPAVAGKTALTRVSVSVAGCTGSPLDIALVAGSVTCSGSASLPWQRYSTSLSFTLPNQDGLTQLNGCVRDQALNVGSVTGTQITLDTQPPTGPALSIASPNGNGYAATLSPVVSGQADDAVQWGLSTSSRGPFSSLTYAATPSTTTFAFGGTGPRTVYGVFVDDVGNASDPIGASITIDTTAPPVPRFYSVELANRSAHLFWDAVTDNTGILRYELWCGTTSPSALCATVPGTASDGWVLNLANRRDQVFAVQAVDLAGNVSGLSTTLSGTVGFKRIAVPFASAYSVIPLDVATRGDDIYLTYSERDADWTISSGNLRVAVSNDRGLTWRFSPLDPNFGWDRQFGHIAFTDSAVLVGTIGTAQTIEDVAAGTAWSDRGQVRLYSSQNSGTSWEETIVTNLSSSSNWANTTGLGLWTSGQRFGLHYRLGSNDDLRIVYGSSGGTTGYLYSLPYYTPSVTSTALRSCAGNYTLVHAWKNGTGMQSLTHYYFNQVSVNTAGGEGSYQTVSSGTGAGNEVAEFDLACVSLPEATQAYVVYTSTSGSSLYLRRKLTASSSWTGYTTIVSDADRTQAPRIWAGSRNVYVLYRNTSNELVLAESTDEGASWVSTARTRLERGVGAGLAPVMSGENSSDVAVAFTDSTGTSLTVLVPAMPAVKSVATPGITTSRLGWTPVSGVDRYQIALGTSPSTITDVNYSSVVSYDVPQGASPMYYSVRAMDDQGMPGNDGPVWQTQPATDTTVIASVNTTGTSSSSGGIVAYNQSAVLLPPYGMRGTSDSDLTVYRTSNGGQTWTAHTPTTATTTAARALVGTSGKAVLLYRTSASAGLRARIYTDLMGAAPGETVIDASSNVDLLAARADTVNNRILVAYVNSATDTIRTAWWDHTNNSFTLGTAFTVPNAGAATFIEALDVVRVDSTRTVIAWRQQYTGTEEYQQVYVADSANGGTSWNTPLLVTNGTLTDNLDNFLVGSGTNVSGAGNSAYTFVAHATQQSPLYGRGDNLYLSVVGTDIPASSYFTKFVIDRDSAVADSIASWSNADGQYLAYTTVEPGGTQNRLKLAYCATDCQLPANWRRTIVKTFPSTNGRGTLFAVAQASTPLMYLAYRNYNSGTGAYELRVLTGGVERLVR